MANALPLVALLVAGCAALASAITYTVGDWQGWNTGVNYSNWTSDKSFGVGDKLVFSYVYKEHTVTEVCKSGYDTCNGTNAFSNDESGSTTITLTTPGTHYFICSVPEHCSRNASDPSMKLAVTVSATPSNQSAAGDPRVPAMASVVAAAAGAAIKLALF